MAFSPSPASLQREYVLCSALDPALDLPTVPTLADDASDEDKAHRDKVLEERNTKLRIARDYGDWNAITKPGQSATRFRFRHIHGTALTWLNGVASRKDLTPDEVYELAFRLALVGIDNFGSFKHEYELVEDYRVTTRACLDQLYDIGRASGEPLLGRAIIIELGMLAYTRAIQGVPPLS